MKINKLLIGLGILNMLVGLNLMGDIAGIMLGNPTIYLVSYIFGVIIAISGIWIFLSGIKLNKNEVLE